MPHVCQESGYGSEGSEYLGRGADPGRAEGGGLLKEMESVKGGRPKNGDTLSPLKAVGVTKKQSSSMAAASRSTRERV